MIKIAEQYYEFNMIPQAERYYNEDTTWGVYFFSTKDDIPELKEFNEDPFNQNSSVGKGCTLTGKMQKLYIGTEYKVKAKLEYSQKYKTYNYIPTIITANVPKTEAQQELFLQSLVTPTQAKTIIEKYPNIINDVIGNNDNVDITCLKGIGKSTWDNIKEKILDNYVISDILSLLQPLGVTYNLIRKLINNESNPSLLKQNLLDNPYMMTEIKGLGFKKVDDLAMKLNPDMRISKQRVYAFIKYYFEEQGNKYGHTWTFETDLNNVVRDNINECYSIFEEVIQTEKRNGLFLIHKDGKIGLSKYYNTEINTYKILKTLNSYKKEWNIDVEKAIKESEEQQGFEFTDEQKDVIKKATEENVIVISGLSGTGKTTITRAILNTYKNYSIGCAALSAKASQRITEATGFSASTIHRMLGWDGKGFIHNYNNPLPYDVILIDECSMISANIFYSLVSAVKQGGKVIMCGDNGQLPPIGYGNIYNDLLEKSNDFCVNKLTKILRQAEKSGIITDSVKIRQGVNPLDKPEIKVVNGELQDMTYMFRENREGIRDLAIKTYLKSIEQTGLDETVIIVPRKSNCDNSTFEINRIIQDELINKKVQGINYGVLTYRIGAKVIQRANNYDKNVFNGEVGYIKNIWKEKNTQMFSVEFKLGNNTKMVTFSQGDLENIDLAYALTCHLSQGSGYKNVITIIDNTHYSLLDSCLLYTAITRAKKKSLLIAEPSAFNRCLKENKTKTRQTWLSIM